MLAKLRNEVLERNEYPPIIGEMVGNGNWYDSAFKCWQPDELDNEEFNLILKSRYFKNGYALAMSIDFDFIAEPGEL